MSRATTKPLPASLPPVPAGFDRLVEAKRGTLTGSGHTFFCYHGGDVWQGPYLGAPANTPGVRYFVAVKRPAKASAAKKTPTSKQNLQVAATKKPERKAGRVVAKSRLLGNNIPVFVLPADAASVERMAEQVNRAVRPDLFSDDPVEAHRAASPYTVESRRAEIDRYTRIALAAIGIAATGKGARK